MASGGGGRSVWGIVWKNFVNSLRPRQLRGNLMGVDQKGTKYFEVPADPSTGRRHPSRWFMPKGGEADNFDMEIPAEWESWLRGRRLKPPTPQEIEESVRMMKQKRENAAALERAFTSLKPDRQTLVDKRGVESFPQYSEYELHPGKKTGKS